MKTKLAIIILFFFCSTFLTYSFELRRDIQIVGKSMKCKIAEIDDGDTVNLDCENEFFTDARLLGINAPDKDQDVKGYEHCYYKEAKKILESIKKRDLEVNFYGGDLCKDPYKGCRNVVRLIDIETGSDLNELLISKGFAFSWTQFSMVPQDLKMSYIKAENKARNDKIGLWGKCPVKYFGSTYLDSGIPNRMTE